MQQPFLVVVAHKYVGLSDLKDRRAQLLPQCREWNLKGDIVLSPEGIRVSVGGEDDGIARLVDELRRWPGLRDLQLRATRTERIPFVRMHVRVKPEIVPPVITDVETLPYVRDEPVRYAMSAADMAHLLAERSKQIATLIQTLPGSVPEDQFRPITIPTDCDGLTLNESLLRIVSHIPERFWQERFERGLLLDPAGHPVDALRRVHAGEQYRHRFPSIVEPDVNMHVTVLHEDDALIVLNKPAPLPMHAGGRFQRNTLKHLLDALYAPEKPLPAHRLDANTKGVLIAARTSWFAGKIQPQFARGEVEKTYLVRVHGHPVADSLVCTAPISSDAGHAGSRMVDEEKGQPARTDFRVLQRLPDGTSLLEAHPRTGRTNQIRVHLWHLGTPVCGDPVYLRDDELGDSQTLPVGAPPLCLHAWRIRLRHPLSKEACEFAAPAPDWFTSVADQRDDFPAAATCSPST